MLPVIVLNSVSHSKEIPLIEDDSEQSTLTALYLLLFTESVGFFMWKKMGFTGYVT
jgi:hypothetical protein